MAACMPKGVVIERGEYDINVHRKEGTVVISIWWNLGNFLDLAKNAIYVCPSSVTNALCCPHWKFGVKKFDMDVFISLKCNLIEKDVSFNVIPFAYKDPFFSVAGNEDVPGIYSCMIPSERIHAFMALLEKSSFLLMCRIQINDGKMANTYYPNPTCSCDKLTYDLKTIFTNLKFHDIKLINRGKEFPAHKCFLSARSAILKAAFDEMTVDKRDYFLKKEDISDAGVIEALRYIYTGTTLDLNVELAISLYHLSEEFDLKKLQEKCVNFLSSKLTVENFMKIYCFAKKNKVKKVNNVVQLFLVCHRQDIREKYFVGETMIRPEWMKNDQDYLITGNDLGLVTGATWSSKFY